LSQIRRGGSQQQKWRFASSVGSSPLVAHPLLQHEFAHPRGFKGWLDNASGTVSGNDASIFDALVRLHPQGAATGPHFLGACAIALYGEPVPLTGGNHTHFRS